LKVELRLRRDNPLGERWIFGENKKRAWKKKRSLNRGKKGSSMARSTSTPEEGEKEKNQSRHVKKKKLTQDETANGLCREGQTAKEAAYSVVAERTMGTCTRKSE